MSQRDLDREVARTTGESVSMIRSFGFSEPCVLVDAEDLEAGYTGPQTIDWDKLDAERRVPLVLQTSRLGLVA